MRQVRQKQLFIGLIIGAAALAGVYLARVVLLPLALATVLAYLVLPLTRRLEGRGLPGGLAAALALAVFFGLLALLAIWGWPLLCRDFSALGALSSRAGFLLASLNKSCRGLFGPVLANPGGFPFFATCFDQLINQLGGIFSVLLQQSLAALPGFIGSISLLIFTPVFAFYLLRDREQLMGFMPRFLRPLLLDLNHIMQAFVRGYLLVALVVGVLFGLLARLFGLHYSFTLGLIMLLAELVPYLGPFLAFFPCMALGLVQGRLAFIKLLLIWFAVQQLENLLISPHIMSGAMRLPPFYIMLAVLIGGFWFGVFGMILAVPLAAALRVICNAVMRWWRLSEGVRPEDWI